MDVNVIGNIIREVLNEILDYDEKSVNKKSKSKTYTEPISGTKIVNIDGTIIKLSFLIDEFNNSLEVSFSDEKNSFESLTNNNIIGEIFSNITYHTIQFLKEIDKKIKLNDAIEIKKIVFTPTKIKGKEENLKASETKRGRLYVFFTKKILDIKSVNSNNFTVELYLAKTLRLANGDGMKNFKIKGL